MNRKTSAPNDHHAARRAESLFLASLVLSMSAWVPGCDEESGDDPDAPSTKGDASTGGEASTEGTVSMGGGGTTGDAISTGETSATSGNMPTGDTAGGDPTGDPSTADGGAQTGADTSPCVALAETLERCGYEDPEYYREYCEYILDEYATEFGEACASAWSDWYACLADLSCVEIATEGEETEACAKVVSDDCAPDGGDNGGSLE